MIHPRTAALTTAACLALTAAGCATPRGTAPVIPATRPLSTSAPSETHTPTVPSITPSAPTAVADLPEGQYLAYIAAVHEHPGALPTSRLYAVSADGGPPYVLMDNAPDYTESISPDGLAIRYWQRASPLHLRGLTGGEDREVPGTLGCIWASWSPDLQHLACSDGDVGDVRIVDLGSGKVIQLGVCPPDDIEQGVVCEGSLWSPDGRWIAYRRYIPRSGPPGSDEGIYIIDATCIPRPDTCRFSLLGPLGLASSLSWSPDGSRLAAATTDGLLLFDMAARSWSGVPLDGIFRTISQVSWSPDGNLLAFVESDHLFMVGPGGGSPIQLAIGHFLSIVGWFIIG
jgi:WD40 repeat protein